MIDHILISYGNKQEITDVIVKRGPNINSDHYLLLAKLKMKETNTGDKTETYSRKSN